MKIFLILVIAGLIYTVYNMRIDIEDLNYRADELTAAVNGILKQNCSLSSK